jgi:DNA-binding CsgD family transcriptional regulator/tetratricopeptide (TPR) repeat protein
MQHTVQGHRVERASFGADAGPSFERARVSARLDSVERKRIALLIAPAGWGKTTALRAVHHERNRSVRSFDARDYRDDFQSLLRDIDKAVADNLARIAVDSLDALFRDRTTLESLIAAVEAAPPEIRWTIASRGTFGLPVASWQAYGHSDAPLDTADLRLTHEEIAEFLARGGVTSGDARAIQIEEIAGGWPAAATFQSNMRRNASSFWREQVFAAMQPDELECLRLASLLPAVDLRILETAGCTNAAVLLEAVSAKTSIVQRDNGKYRWAPLVRDALLELPLAEAERRDLLSRASIALERFDLNIDALRAASAAGVAPEIQRLIAKHGIALLDRGESQTVRNAIEAIEPATRETDASILTLRGLLYASSGNPIRAEATLRRAVALADSDPTVEATARLKLAALVWNHGGTIDGIVEPLLESPRFSPSIKAEVVSLLGAMQAAKGQRESAQPKVDAATLALAEIPFDSSRARTLQRVGVASMYLGRYGLAKEYLGQASELALELDNYSVASRAFSALSNLVCHEYDDVMAQLWYAERAVDAATKSHDAVELQTAMVQVAAAEMRRGNAEESAGYEDLVAGLRSDPRRAAVASSFKALRLAWDGEFAQAHRLLAPCWRHLNNYFDSVLVGGQYAAFLALDDRRGPSIEAVSDVLAIVDSVEPQGLFRIRCVTLGLLFCVIAETLNERTTHASRIARRIFIKRSDPVTGLTGRIAREFIARGPSAIDVEALLSSVGHLPSFGYADVSRVLEAVLQSLGGLRDRDQDAVLTAAEVNVLQLLAEGFSTKDIAEQSGRSVNTIRAHLANAINKLQCHGRVQAVAAARRRRLIS